MKIRPLVLVAALLAATTGSSSAAMILFNLQGTAGAGLLPGNEPGAVVGGTGGEISPGITFDNVLKVLSINVGWGSSQGFTNLSNTASASHIHVTAANFGFNGTANFTQTGGTVFTLIRSNDAITGGTVTQNFTLTAGQEADLLNTKYYINIHTTGTNSGGEMRGFLVAVPEPSGALLSVAGLGLLAYRRKRGA